MTDFSGHSEADFWDGSGRLGVGGTCNLIAPAFAVGKLYLALLGVEPDMKQYEQIGDNDRWLAYVEARVRAE